MNIAFGRIATQRSLPEKQLKAPTLLYLVSYSTPDFSVGGCDGGIARLHASGNVGNEERSVVVGSTENFGF